MPCYGAPFLHPAHQYCARLRGYFPFGPALIDRASKPLLQLADTPAQFADCALLRRGHTTMACRIYRSFWSGLAASDIAV